jgi:hypothetical protein
MSLDGDVNSSLGRPDDTIPPPVPTRRTPDDEPTLAGRPIPGFLQSIERTSATSATSRESFDDSTMKRPRLEPGRMNPSLHRHPKSDGVVTSAPPVTQRDLPPSMAMSEGPTFSLRNDPVFSLRNHEPAPVTERMPHARELSTAERPVIAFQGAAHEEPRDVKPPSAPDAAAIFRAALANTALGDDDAHEKATQPRFDPVIAAMQQNAPRPAAGAPPDLAPPEYPTSPSMRTAPGIGAPPLRTPLPR